MNTASLYEKKNNDTYQDTKFTNLANTETNLNIFLGQLQRTVEQWQSSILHDATNITQLFNNGSMVNQSSLEFNSDQTSQAAGWLERYMTMRMINNAWWSQNVFIAYMPVS